MRTFKGLLVVLVLVSLAGCTSQSNDNETEESNASFEDILTGIKEQIAEDLKEDGVEEEVLVDGKLTFFLETDLTASEDSDSSIPIWIENMDLNTEEIANGKVIAAMMNVNADEIILLEAKDEKHVESLKVALEKELENQGQMWKQYLPDQFEKVKANKISTNGEFLLYVTYSYPEKIEQVFNSEFK